MTAIDNAGNVSETIHYEIPQTIDLTTSIAWNDNNNRDNVRPNNNIITLYQNGNVYKTATINENTTSFTFGDLPKWDDSHNTYSYTIGFSNNDRYNQTINGNIITMDYKSTNFSVIIPKTITLNGNTCKGNYNIKTSGNLYYNDTITITPSSSFILKDKNNISSLQGNITQTITSFNKNNLGTTNGNITLNKTKFAGKYEGTFNFNIKFTLKN